MNKQHFSTNIMKKTLWAALLFCLPWTAPAQRKGNMSEMEQSMRKLSMAQLAISSLYVDSVDEVKLTEDAINGIDVYKRQGKRLHVVALIFGSNDRATHTGLH